MPVPVWMQGTLAWSTQVWIREAPPRGMSRSMYPTARMSSLALARVVLVTRLTRAVGRWWAWRALCRAATMAVLEWMDSLPPRSTHTLPAWKVRLAASEVTLGRDS